MFLFKKIISQFLDPLSVEKPNPLFPSSINIRKTELALHEYMGMIWGKMRGQI